MAKRHFFYGTMKSSKSAQLIIQAFNLENQGKNIVIFKSETDSRDEGYIKSRATSEQRKAIKVKNSDIDFMYNYVKQNIDNVDFVFVDEVQFLTTNQIEELARISVELDKPVFAYGLLITYFGKMFESSKRLIECGFTMNELKIQCDYCHNKATHHLLLSDGNVVKDMKEVVVGDEEYKIVCYPCFHKKYNN